MRDRLGLETTTGSERALGLYERALRELLEQRLAAASTVEAAIAADPGFALARCLKACLLRGQATRRLLGEAAAELALARAERGRLTARERLHLDAATAWVGNDPAAAIGAWRAIVEGWPRDLLAVRLLHHTAFWSGRRELMTEAPARALEAFDPSLPGYGFLLGMLAFAREEAGELAAAERLGREAAARNPEDMWAVHAVAHVLETADRAEEGAAWLDHPPERWADRTSMRGHLAWHAALFRIERGRPEEALALYDGAIRPGERATCVDLHNAASLLARLELSGLRLDGRWQALAEHAAVWVGDHLYPLTDLHVAWTLARTGRPEAEALLASLERLAERPGDPTGALARPLLLPLARAVLAFHRGEPGRAVDLLLALGPVPPAVGGSNAQRDLFALLLLEAALAAGRIDLARRLAAERARARPRDWGARRGLERALAAAARPRPTTPGRARRRAAPPPALAARLSGAAAR